MCWQLYKNKQFVVLVCPMYCVTVQLQGMSKSPQGARCTGCSIEHQNKYVPQPLLITNMISVILVVLTLLDCVSRADAVAQMSVIVGPSVVAFSQKPSSELIPNFMAKQLFTISPHHFQLCLTCVSRAHEIEMKTSSVVRPSVASIISEVIAWMSFKFQLWLPLAQMFFHF